MQNGFEQRRQAKNLQTTSKTTIFVALFEVKEL
jgi:hypothetical protein